MSHTPLFRLISRALMAARARNLEAAGEPAPIAGSRKLLSRRRLLAMTGTAAAGAALWRPGALRAQQTARIGIVGAGLSGLNAALQLADRGHEVRVFEARERIGGRVLSVVGALGDELVLDVGGSLINSDHPEMLGLAERFGVELFARSEHAPTGDAPESAFFFEGRRIDMAELAPWLQPLAAQITADADRLDADYDAAAPELDALSVKDYLDKHAGLIPNAIVRALIESAVRTEYGVEPEQSSTMQLIYILPTVEGDRVDLLGTSDEAFQVMNGSAAIPQAIAAELGDRIVLNAPVKRIIDDGEAIEFQLAGGEIDRFDYAVIALPLPVLRQVEIAAELPETFRQFMAEGQYGHNEKLIVSVTGRPWHDTAAFQRDFSSDLGFAAGWDNSLRQTERPTSALTLFHGGEEVTALWAGDSAAALDRELAALEPVIPGITAAATGRHLRTGWHRAAYTGGAYSTFAPGQFVPFAEHFWVEGETPDAHSGPVFGRLAFVGEHFSDAFYGFMNGAAETGRFAAEVLHQTIAG